IHQAVLWITQVLDALSYAHDQGIIHRDINPSNIHISTERVPQVMDFGISDGAGTRVSTEKGIWGTVNYLAPELLGNGVINPATDIYSLGLVLYEMVTGKPVISARDHMAAMYRIAHEEVPPLSKSLPDADRELERILQRSLEKSPRDRYTSATEMKQELEAFLEGQEETADLQNRQSTLNFLLRRMRQKSDFPAVSQHITEVNQKTAAIEHGSVDELANVILKDYALTTKLLKLVNSSLYGQYGGSISTVSRAVVILGYKQVRMAALSLVLFDQIKGKGQSEIDILKEMVGHSFFSGVLGQRLAGQVKGAEPEQSFICAMFHNLGKYLTAFYFPEEYDEILRSIHNRGMEEDSACRTVLGLTYAEIGGGVAKEWHLPTEIRYSMQPLPDGPIPPVTKPQEILHQLTVFSNQLSDVIATSPPDKKDAGIAALCKRFGTNIKVDKKSISTVVESALNDVQIYAKTLNMDLKGSQFYKSTVNWLQGNPESDGQYTATISGMPKEMAPDSNQEKEKTPQHTLLNGIQDITQALVENYSLNDILIMVLETIYRGMGFTRTLLCIRDIKHAKMIARFGLGKEIDTILPRFQYSILRRRDPFNSAVNEKRDITYSIATSGARQLPEWYRDLIPTSTFVLFPMVINNVCLGLIYADREEINHPVTPEDVNYLNTLRNQASLAIKQRS
ncbi:MAG: HDOD domain-containing protein, partial [Gammaproteobacteria bacterium]|nr:HDOD domain-containing protein [Gammaproteobacteria bacterium]